MSRNGHRLFLDEDGKAKCPESGIDYRLSDSILIEDLPKG
jgi:hypothetical protein